MSIVGDWDVVLIVIASCSLLDIVAKSVSWRGFHPSSFPRNETRHQTHNTHTQRRDSHTPLTCIDITSHQPPQRFKADSDERGRRTSTQSSKREGGWRGAAAARHGAAGSRERRCSPPDRRPNVRDSPGGGLRVGARRKTSSRRGPRHARSRFVDRARAHREARPSSRCARAGSTLGRDAALRRLELGRSSRRPKGETKRLISPRKTKPKTKTQNTATS